MCDFCNRNFINSNIYPYLANESGGTPPHTRELFQYGGNNQTCPICGKLLSMDEMRPSGRASRSLCESCYTQLVPQNVGSGICLICGDQLPGDKINAQHNSPREIRAHIHEGYCLAIFGSIHNIVLGTPGFVGTPNEAYDTRQSQNNLIEMVQSNQNRGLPQPAQACIQHQPQQTMDDFFEGQWSQTNDQGQKVQEVYNGNPVRVYRQN